MHAMCVSAAAALADACLAALLNGPHAMRTLPVSWPCSVYNAGHEISHRYNEVRGSAGTALWVKGAALRRPCQRAGCLPGPYNVPQTTCLYACPWIPAQVLFPAEPGKKGRRGGVA